ncbi:hypothetical protein [Desulfosporosinus sp. BICA1-9]|uniref:hypothetical protein n=1 Tax=Desulfosporosinus sp. BICA1-9 TaxID=1531958 RepID=UPI00054B9C79|nr:hypothetical protein [Desulfosporosinus sp. BICA1-9]KJS47650.1 MAG: hypothetical protein VR66_18475 [Peptococcaceae bacterium BRH_c23]KJS89146.1 MAG: hypothetical protein JL57_09030 [Desulfosporosinus sp. BICA1-9]HBW38523.1 hypothetical protein [Desulfosporosinus sp.]
MVNNSNLTNCYKEYIKKEIEQIEDLKAKGHTVKYILELNAFSYEALENCGLPESYLVPTAEPQTMSIEEWDTHTSAEHKWEYDGTPFMNRHERDRVMLGLLFSAGLKHLLEILPTESKEELKKLLIPSKI